MATLKQLVPVDSNGFCSGKFRKEMWDEGCYFEPKFLHGSELGNKFVGVNKHGNVTHYYCDDGGDWETFKPRPVIYRHRVYKYIILHYYDRQTHTYSQRLTEEYYAPYSRDINPNWIKSPHHFLDVEVEEGSDNVHVL